MTFKDISKLLKMPIGTVQWKYYTSIHTLKILIGNISFSNIVRGNFLSCHLGYKLDKDEINKGYMTEAAHAIMDYAFEEFDLTVMGICTSPNNKRSQRVIEKCGFKYEGCQRRGYHIFDGSDRDNLLYSILREEWEQLKK